MRTFETFGNHLFDRKKMAEHLPRPIYLKLMDAIRNEVALDRSTADAIAHAMKTWAIAQGATHFSHLFLPLSGVSAEKHEAFLSKEEDEILVRFSGSQLIKGETDGSSFPTGGLRQTFEARGYTYWDITSSPFVRGHVLYVPSIFVSYRGDKLDVKAPLLDAINVLNVESTRLLNLLGKPTKYVKPMIGLEQEYFLVDTEYFKSRPDLIYTGRTLMGDTTPKGQEFDDHYFGVINDRINCFMEDVDKQCWLLGIALKVEHNEVAPAQYECSTIYEEASLAVDQNVIVMDILKKTALKHQFTVLFHEKPFKGINGSGKHNNFSLSTDTGLNVFEPAKDFTFLLFMSAFIASVDKFGSLLRLFSSDASNDYRLGASEAPPAIVSVFVGADIASLFEQIKTTSSLDDIVLTHNEYSPLINIETFPHENTDRNRTSPITFTGNKFELRMLGSSRSGAPLNMAVCTALADEIRVIAKRLEAASDVSSEALTICRELLVEHERILYEGDGYSEDWVVEAERRGLPNFKSFEEAIDELKSQEVIDLYQRTGVLSEQELLARVNVFHHQFELTLRTEGLTLVSMVRKSILPALMKYIREVMRTEGAMDVQSRFINKQKQELSFLLDSLDEKCSLLEEVLADERTSMIRPLMDEVRHYCDQIERTISAVHYPFPTYQKLLFS